MREVNFSIPNANKASVGITTALYDRRALDCTSTLPLINSLNHLAYLTTSSGRIRDILTVDGGIERLVCILKEGRSKDMMEMWKWNLAFQCIVNIGVRGSEAVRTRVVEADMVPVIATILDNYFQVVEKLRERTEQESRRKCPFGSTKSFSRSSARAAETPTTDSRSARLRRQAPPPIAIPDPSEQPEADDPSSEVTPTASAAALSLSSPPERTSFLRQHHHHRSHGASRGQFSSPSLHVSRPPNDTPSSANPIPSSSSSTGMFGFRPVRDADRLPSMVPTLHAELSSQPQSPTTPHAPIVDRPDSPLQGIFARRRRPSVRHQVSVSGSDDDGQSPSDPDVETGVRQPEVMIQVQNDIIMSDIVDEESLLGEPQTDNDAITLTVPNVLGTDATDEDDTFNITHRSVVGGADGSLVGTPRGVQIPFQLQNLQNVAAPLNAVNATPPNLQLPPTWYPTAARGGLPSDRSTTGSTPPATILAAMPRDEDVLMSLQLLAYVSKYCNLRTYFQRSHLVPRLKIGKDLLLLDADAASTPPATQTEAELLEEWENEFVTQPGLVPFNIFPLIEKFTAKPSSRHSSSHPASSPQQGDMQYWAGVVMRNLCRKDDSRGGIRQCAYWMCGKWEQFPRQFAKCRRCRRTKYCSKECQKGSWGGHRFWCVAAESGVDGEGESRHSRRHGHSHHHHNAGASTGHA